jgi:Ca2+-binding EF-hand superfamily protein
MFKVILIAGVLALASSAAVAHERRGGGQVFEHSDTNKDGSVARDEFLAARADQFAKLDKNSDGFLDDADLPERAKEHRGERGGKMRQQFDTNGDGKLAKDEFVNGPTPMFDAADKNGNGVLDASELEAARTAMRSRIEERRKGQQ